MVSFTCLTKSKTLPLFLNASFLILLSFYVTTSVLLPSKPTSSTFFSSSSSNACSGLHDYPDYTSKCIYVKSHIACRPKGRINYLEIFYCNCGRFPPLGGALLTLWLVVLFYILGNTASDYFCPSVENLSKFLNLTPIIAGTTLLPLGNGAPDVFASIISFTRLDNGNIGLSSVLGGAFFISTVVVGILCILNTSTEIIIDKPSFIRNILFLIFSLSFLLIIVTIGEINLWVTICFASIYILYVFVVSIMHCISSDEKHKTVNPAANTGSLGEIGVPLLGCVDEEKCVLDEKDLMINPKPGSGRHDYIRMFRYIFELPLYLPRRVTIPVVGDEKWSKPFAVISVTLAPILLALVWNTQREEMSSKTRLLIYMIAGLIGLVLGNLAFVATKKDRPPQKCLWPWLAGGFVMSIAWTYIIAQELVSLLVSAGNIIGLSPSILGLTVLAWGNSFGDLIANVAMATEGGPNGAQIAISGCYAGPVFNILVGLGVSLVLACWSEYPISSYVIPPAMGGHVYETIGFFVGGLLWALVILPKNNMRLDRKLGVGLLAIYFCFLCLNFSRTFGLLSSVGMPGSFEIRHSLIQNQLS